MRGGKGLLVYLRSLFPSAAVSFFFFSQFIVLSKGKQVQQDLNHIIFWSLLVQGVVFIVENPNYLAPG